MSQTKAQLVQPVGIVTGTGINVTGVITATSFVGSGEGLTGVASTDNIITGTAATFNNTVNLNSSLNATRLNVSGVSTFNDNVRLLDNDKLQVGTGQDLELYHDGTETWVKNGTGTLNFTNDGITQFKNAADNETLATFTSNGACTLYHDNSAKIATNASGVTVTGTLSATTVAASLESTGTPTLGLGVTINSSGVAISGVATAGILSATTLYGDGSNLTGVGESIAPWYYNPDINDIEVDVDTGIGITFNKKVLAGSGTATLKIVNAGAAGTTVQSWGVSSCTFATTVFSLNALVSDLSRGNTYQLDIPSGFIVDSAGSNYAGTAYTFAPAAKSSGDPMTAAKAWSWGNNTGGALGLNQTDNLKLSSPVQIPGTTWGRIGRQSYYAQHYSIIKTDNTLWTWGTNAKGELGIISDNTGYSSPVQIPGATWTGSSSGQQFTIGVRDDGTLWGWGYNHQGQLGQNDVVSRSSPTQIGSGTDWAFANGGYLAAGYHHAMAIKQDGTLWIWGNNGSGQLGQSEGGPSAKSSPVQIPGTSWDFCAADVEKSLAINTSDDLFTWGKNQHGQLGMNMAASAYRSSPIQVPGDWKSACFGDDQGMGIKTNGELFAWGNNNYGQCAQNNSTPGYSSPIQIPGTNWSTATRISNASGSNHMLALKTDGTLWAWGYNGYGLLGQNNRTNYSSPVQVMSYSDVLQCDAGDYGNFFIENS